MYHTGYGGYISLISLKFRGLVYKINNPNVSSSETKSTTALIFGVSSWSKKLHVLQFLHILQILHILHPLHAHPTSIPRLGGSHAPAQDLSPRTKVCSLKCAPPNSPRYVPQQMCKCVQEQICNRSCAYICVGNIAIYVCALLFAQISHRNENKLPFTVLFVCAHT